MFSSGAVELSSKSFRPSPLTSSNNVTTPPNSGGGTPFPKPTPPDALVVRGASNPSADPSSAYVNVVGVLHLSAPVDSTAQSSTDFRMVLPLRAVSYLMLYA